MIGEDVVEEVVLKVLSCQGLCIGTLDWKRLPTKVLGTEKSEVSERDGEEDGKDDLRGVDLVDIPALDILDGRVAVC